MSLAREEERRIFDYLRGKGCCLKCCLRFLGLRTQECYENPLEFAKQFGYDSGDGEVLVKGGICVACLGILQKDLEEEIIQKVEDTVREKGFDCETFTSGLMLPVCIHLRERLLQTGCADELGLSNDTLRTLKQKLQSVKDIWKTVTVPKLERSINKRSEQVGSSPFLVEIVLQNSNDEKECKGLLSVCKSTGNSGRRKRKHGDNKLSRKSMEVLMEEMSDEKFSRHCNGLALEETCATRVAEVNCSHTSIFIGGRYAKLSRQLSQTPWFINGEKRMETSVQDILCGPIADAVKSRVFKFLSSGREDVDVRNIHAGRPFAIELLDPRMTNVTTDLLTDLVKRINESSKQAQITSNLRVLSRADLKSLKDGENVKTKIYRALCVCRDGSNRDGVNLDQLNGLKRVEIVQKTPLRVLHRRPLTPRTRCIYEMRARWATAEELAKLLSKTTETADMFFVLDMKTQAGTYVKEFVHGDFGRTRPSLCDLLRTEVDIVALDVTGINLDWP